MTDAGRAGSVPKELRAALERGLHIQPDDRTQTMHALIAELEAAVGGDGHVRIHQYCQSAFAAAHALVLGWFVYDVYFKEGTPSSASRAVSPNASTDESGLGIAAALIIVWVLMAMMFLFGGTFWAVLNAIGLAGRRKWARYTTLLYGVFAFTSCIGIPYGVYTLWSLTREDAKRSLVR
jgi:hypothetical protein